MSLRALGRRLPEPLKRSAQRLLRRLAYQWGPHLMSELRKRWVILSHPGATIRFEGPVHIASGFTLHFHRPGRGTFIVGPNVEFRRNFLAELGDRARIEIKEGCIIGYDAVLAATTSIELDKYCILAPSVYVSDGKHDYSRDVHKPMIGRGYRYQPVRLGTHSGVYTKSTVMASVGDRSMVLGHSLVREPIPPNYAAAGVPARLTWYFGPPDEEPDEGRRERLAWEAERQSRRMSQTGGEDAASAPA